MGQVIYPRWRPFLVPWQALYPRWSLSQFHLSQLVPQSGSTRPRNSHHGRRGEGTGTWPDYLANRAELKNEGAFGETNSRKSRNSCRVNGGGVGAHRQLTPGPNVPSPETKYKRSKNVISVLSIAFNLGHIWARLFELPAQSLIGSPGTLRTGDSELRWSFSHQVLIKMSRGVSLSWARGVNHVPTAHHS